MRTTPITPDSAPTISAWLRMRHTPGGLSRLTRRFNTIRWRLTFSYMLITVLLGLVLQLALLTLASQLFLRSAQLPSNIAQSLESVTPGAAPYLAHTPPDVAGLRHWLRQPSATTPSAFAQVVLFERAPGDKLVADAASAVAVVDTHGVTLASNTRQLPTGAPISIAIAPQAAALVRAALGGQTNPATLATGSWAHGVAAAAPILSDTGTVLGAVYFVPALGSLQYHLLAAELLSLLPSAAVLTVIAGLAGTLYGFFTARGLTRRIETLTSMADAWSQGDFVVSSHDTSGDELGQLARDLNRMAERLQSLLVMRQELAVVEERNRLARDLHDAVKQQVFATSMQVAAARELMKTNREAAEARLNTAERLAGEAQQELTTLIHELRPAALAHQGLAPALRAYCKQWSQRTGVAVTVRAQDEQPTPIEIEQALFRVTQEALTNVERHSGAMQVEVHLRWQAETVTLTVADDGRGLATQQHRGKGIGLRTMRERVEAVGGALRFSPAGEDGAAPGLRIEAVAPLTIMTPLASPTWKPAASALLPTTTEHEGAHA